MSNTLAESKARLEKVAAEVNEEWRRYWEMRQNPQFEYGDAGKILGQRIAEQQQQDRERRESIEAFRRSVADIGIGQRLEY